MAKEPKNRDEEIEDEDETVDPDVRQVAESLEGYQDYLKEIRGDNLTYGDY